jgi:hypothetical protein
VATQTPNKRREQAGYKAGATKDRCATCAMRTASVLSLQAGRNDFHCAELDAPVNATGTCRFYLPDRNADMPITVTNGIKP